MDESSFFSLDKLVEFGCGMAVATQMANSMNASLAQMHTPGVDYSMQGTESALFYVALDGKAAGPFSSAELSQLTTDGRIANDTYVWKPGMSNWQHAGETAEILRLVALTPPPVPGE
ncbi:MAG: DUF4339 domain-containing protein [Eggerthellaceae bacterium]|nr:DUF4339 domain-containing protein [Eggerthellaceae bacterium]